MTMHMTAMDHIGWLVDGWIHHIIHYTLFQGKLYIILTLCAMGMHVERVAVTVNLHHDTLHMHARLRTLPEQACAQGGR